MVSILAIAVGAIMIVTITIHANDVFGQPLDFRPED